MKKFILFLGLISVCIVAEAYTINWHIGNSIYQTTTCESGDNITPPTPPEKYGYHLKGWYAYRELEYLESTGTQLIDTLYKLKTSNVLEVSYQFLSTGSIGSNWFGFTQESSYIAAPSGYGVSFSAPFSKHTVKFDAPNNSVYLGNKLNFSSNSYTPSNTNVSYKLFANVSGTKHSARFYYLKIYDNNVLVRDFIPVLDKNGTPCVYDKIENKFYYNAGTGDFTAGPLVYD